MQCVLVPVAAYLLLYAPGDAVLSVFGTVSPSSSRLFRTVLLSAVCASWIGFVLAEARVYSLLALLVILGLVTLAIRVWCPATPNRFRRRDLGGIAIVLLAWIWCAPPLDTRLLGADSSGYLAGGEQLARQGTFILHDPTLHRLSPDLKRSLFPSVAPDRGSPPYLRLMGSMMLRTLDSTEVLPAFHHLILVWVAALFGLGGPPFALWTITLFAGLSVWAVAEFASVCAGPAGALLCAALLSLLAPQYWYSRFLMPEVPAQFFVWGGLCCLAWWQHSRARTDAVLAGLAFGVAGLMRVENVGFLLAALLIGAGLSARHERRCILVVLAAALPLWLHTAVHLFILRTHYLGNLYTLAATNLPPPASPLAVLVLGSCLTLLCVAVSRRLRHAGPSLSAVVVVLLTGGIALWLDFRTGWPGTQLLCAYIGRLTALGGGIGLLLGAWHRAGRTLAFQLLLVLAALVFAQVLLAPNATPVPIWAVRRSVTVLVPALCVGFVLLWDVVRRQWHWAAALGLIGVVWRSAAPLTLTMRREPYYQGATRHVEAIAALIPPGARLLYDGSLIGTQLAPTLWVRSDLPAYFVAPADTVRIRELVRALWDAPVFWINDGSTPPPHVEGVVAVPVAHYEFVLSTPGLDLDSEPGATSNWDDSIGVYALREADATGTAVKHSP